eukprot:EG_transcript_46878
MLWWTPLQTILVCVPWPLHFPLCTCLGVHASVYACHIFLRRPSPLLSLFNARPTRAECKTMAQPRLTFSYSPLPSASLFPVPDSCIPAQSVLPMPTAGYRCRPARTESCAWLSLAPPLLISPALLCAP